MSKILACTDGSLYAPSIYKHAAWASKRIDSPVQVLHMLNPHHETPLNSDYSGSIGFGAKSALLDELVELEAANARIAQKRGQAILEDAEMVLKAEGLENVSTMQKHGKLSDEIVAYEDGADLIVLGKRGNNANFEKGHLGTNLERVIRSCHHPVLVTSREFDEPKNFLLAYDGGSSAEKAIEYAVKNTLLKGMFCHLITLSHDSAIIEKHKAAVKKLETAGYEVESYLFDGSVEEAITDTVIKKSIDLVVMGAFGHSKIRQLFVGSTTSSIIRAIHKPVLLFR
jgi:nucleotide-binding universal stress UspA family protein